jgi:uncharacterized membrane protein
MLIAPHGYRPRQWLFDVEQQIKTRDTNPLRFIQKTERSNYSLPALIQLRNARRVARAVALRAVKSIATQAGNDRAQQQRCLNELIETLNGAWLRGQHNHSNKAVAGKPDACASNGTVDRVAMQRKHNRKSTIMAVKRMRGGLWPENRRSGGKPTPRKKVRRKKR